MPGCRSADGLLQRMAARRSVRRFERREVPRQLVKKLIAAAVTAPSASNKQPWRFVVVTDPKRISSLAAGVREAVARIASTVEEAGVGQAFRAYSESFACFESAPVVIVPLFRPLSLLSHLVDDRLQAAEQERIVALERDAALISVAMAVQNLLLMASELGLGALPMTGPLVACESICRALGVRESWCPVVVIAIGYPAEEPRSPGRKAPAQVTRWIGGDHGEANPVDDDR
jgi:coenzyme F420-0:L-glutamate ligase/coenzyme F420-1:gamma-L-glutamate ligase